MSGGVFAAFVGTESPLSLLWAVPVRGLVVLFLAPHINIAYRVRGYGRLPRRRGATLLISNHQHDLDTMALLMRVYLQGPLRHPVFSVASRRLFEPGFLSTRTPWIAALASRYNLGGFLRAVLGVFPLESQLLTRPVASYAYAWQQPGRKAGELFEPWVLGRIGLAPDAPLKLIWRWRYLRRAQFLASFRVLQPPFKQQEMSRLRKEVRGDLARQQALLRRGATVYLAPEGRYTQDGRLGRFRAAYFSLVPLAEVWLAPISYDPFVGHRLSVLFRVLPRGDRDARLLLLAARPVTASQVAAQAVLRAEGSLRSLQALEREALGLLFAMPADIFPDPRLDKNPVGMLRAAFRGLVRQGWLVRHGDGWIRARYGKNPHFPQVDDLLAYQAGMLEQTLENLRLLQRTEDQSGTRLGGSGMRAPYSK